jgi:hypothetical protein
MPTATANQTDVERVLVEVTSLLLERARAEAEREVEAARGSSRGDAAARALERMRELEDTLRAIQRERAVADAGRAPVPLHREVSKFYEVPGQEDA